MLDMRPKWKAHVHFAPTEDGVYFKTWSSEFAMKGKGLYPWIERLAVHFTGEKTLEELTAGLGEEHRNFILKLTGELFRRGVLTDAEAAKDVPLTEQERRLYEDTLAFLELHADEWAERFLRFRGHRPLVAGSGKSFKACVRSLIRMGVKSPRLLTGDRPAIQPLVEEWSRKDPEFAPVLLDRMPRDKEWAEIDGVIFTGEAAHPDLFRLWSEQARLRGVPFLPVTLHPSGGWAGPLEDADNRASWHCALDRFAGAEPDAGPRPVTADLLLGNVAALEWLKRMAGLPDLSVRNRVVDILPDRLETVTRVIHPSPFSPNANPPVGEDDWNRFSARKEPEDQEAFLDKAEAFTDPRFGILLRCEPGDLWQIPLPLMAATVRLPGSAGTGVRTFIAAGETVRDATEHAVREALAFYAEQVAKALGHEPERGDGTVVWSHGRTWAEWAGNGLLKAWAKREWNRRNPSRFTRLDKASIPSYKHRQALKMIEKRYGRQVELVQVRPELHHAFAVFVMEGTRLLAEGTGRTLSEALDTALLGAIGRSQLFEHHPEHAQDLGEHPWLQAPELETVPAGGGKEHPLAWEEWMKAAERFAQEHSLRIILEPWTRETFYLELGLLVGQTGWQGGDKA
jgi:hypothetical protein